MPASTRYLAVLCMLWASECYADLPENIAPRATVTASSEYGAQYAPSQVTDGKIPAPMSHADVGNSWCVKGNKHPQGVTLSFTWPEQVTVAELVYYGRTAWQWEENWKNFEIRADGDKRILASGTLKKGHGPQPIQFAAAVRVSKLTIAFLDSYGGSNPGAAEIEVFSSKLPPSYHSAFSPPRTIKNQTSELPASSVAEDPQLAQFAASGELGFTQLIAVKRHAITPSHVYTYHVEGQQPGGGLYRLDISQLDTPTISARETLLVDADDGLILDACLSYDGHTVLFSWKRSMEDKLQLYTIDVDGKNLKQLTHDDSNNLNACWLPDDSIAFLSDRKPAFAYCWTSSTPILYRCNRDGSQVQRLSANYLNDFTPSVMEDGRILYSRWEYVDRPAIPIQSLWTMNPDGTGLSGLFGNRVLSPATFMEAHEIPGTGKLLCILTSHNGPCRGAIGVIDPGQGANEQQAITNLTPEINVGLVDKGNGNHIRGPYESPYPLDDRYFIVSRDGSLLLRDYAGSGQATLLSKPGNMGWYSSRPVMARSRPPLRSPGASLAASADGDWATVLVEDVYRGLELDRHRTQIDKIAVVQELEKSQFADVKQRAFGFQFPVVSCGATYAPKKVWGFADVEEDGSAHFRVPSQVPIYFMAVDNQGQAVQRMRSFTHFMPGEQQSCVGCHADRNYVTPRMSARPLAAQREPQMLAEPEWGRRGFSYAHIVQPVLDEHCSECHSAPLPAAGVDLSGDKTDFFNVSYETLARQGKPGANPYTKWIPTFNGQEANILEISPRHWGSPASRLARLLLDGHPDQEGQCRIDVDHAGIRRVLTWIDLNVPYYGTSASNHYDLVGCRRLLPPDLDRVLTEVSQRRCVSCHQQGPPRLDYVRITNPQYNNFLAAPLAKEAGGSERCSQIVFQSRDDPDYQAIMKTFREIDTLIEQNPRLDMMDQGQCDSTDCKLRADGYVASQERGWPQWRGIRRDGISKESGLLQQWPDKGPRRLWSIKGLGTGWSSPIIVDQRLYITGDVDDDLVIFAFDLSGKPIWQTSSGSAWKGSYPGARATCCYSEEHLYHLNAHGRLVCLRASDGHEVWAFNILDRFDAKNITWAMSECLLVDGDRLYVTPGGTKALMAALDKRTGKTVWTTPALADDLASYCSPILFEYEGRRLLANCSSHHGFGVDATTGELLWTVPLTNPHKVNTATPIYGSGAVYYVTPYAQSGRLYQLQLDAGTLESRVEQLWQSELDTVTGSGILINDTLYAAGYKKQKWWKATDWRTGAVRAEQKALTTGAAIYADGRLYCFDDKGAAGLLAPGKDQLQLVGKFQFVQKRRVRDAWAHPVLLDGRLYLRYHDTLTCFDVRAGGSVPIREL